MSSHTHPHTSAGPLCEPAEVCSVGPDECDGVNICMGSDKSAPHASHPTISPPPWRQSRGKSMVSLVNSHTNATRIGWHLFEIDLRFAPGLPPGWSRGGPHAPAPTPPAALPPALPHEQVPPEPGTEAGSYFRLIDFCITQHKAQGPSRTCDESKEEVPGPAPPPQLRSRPPAQGRTCPIVPVPWLLLPTCRFARRGKHCLVGWGRPLETD